MSSSRRPTPPLTVATVAPYMNPVCFRKVTVALFPLASKDVASGSREWIVGPGSTFYPPESAIVYVGIHRCAPTEVYGLQHHFRGLVHVHVFPWIPRPMACAARPRRIADADRPVVAVDFVSQWRLLFEHYYAYDNEERCGLWGGKHMKIDITEEEIGDNEGVFPVSTQALSFTQMFTIVALTALLNSPPRPPLS